MRRRARTARRAEPPAWYREFDPVAWDEPDETERQMISGCPSMRPWPADVHRWHAERRWGEARYRYLADHPALAEQELDELLRELEGT